MIDKVFEIPESLNDLDPKGEIAKTPPQGPVKEKPVKDNAKKKNNVSEEGRLKMLANLKKGREARKMNLNKAHEQRQQELKSDIDSLKQLVKDALMPKPPEGQTKEKPSEPVAPAAPAAPVAPVSPVVPEVQPPQGPKPVVQNLPQPPKVPEVAPPYVIKYAFKRPMWS
jgi:hypothetical protein